MGINFKAAIAGAALALAAWTPANATELVGSSWLPPHHLLTKDVLVAWGEKVSQATNGRVTMKMLPKPVSAPPGTFDAVRDGLADVSLTVHGYTPGRFLLTKLPEFPGVGDSAEVTSVAYHRVYERELAKYDEHKGVKVLAMFTHGPGHIFTTNRAIDTVDKLQGLKIRIGGGVVPDIAQALGTSPILKPASESFELLNAGIADGVFFPLESLESFKINKLIKHATLVPGGMYNVSFVMMMNEATFNKLPKQDQDAIMSVSGEALARMIGQAWDRSDASALNLIKGEGTNIVSANEAFMKAMNERTGGVVTKWIEEVKAKGIDGKAVLDAYRAEVEKVAAGK